MMLEHQKFKHSKIYKNSKIFQNWIALQRSPREVKLIYRRLFLNDVNSTVFVMKRVLPLMHYITLNIVSIIMTSQK